MKELLESLEELIADVESAKYKLEWVLRELDQLHIHFEDVDVDPPDEYREAAYLQKVLKEDEKPKEDSLPMGDDQC